MNTGELASFSSFGSNAQSYSWEFGDGESSTSNNPSHSFLLSGVYEVVLTGDSDGCLGVDTIEVMVGTVGVKEVELSSQIEVYPNPNVGLFNVKLDFNKTSDVNIKIYNSAGKVLFIKNHSKIDNNLEFDLSNYSTGVYLIYIQHEDEFCVKRVSILK